MRKLLALVPALLNATEEGKIEWENSGFSDNELCAKVGKDVIYIKYIFDSDAGESAYIISMRSKGGSEIGRYLASDSDSSYARLRELFDSAMGNANGLGEKVENINDYLKSL